MSARPDPAPPVESAKGPGRIPPAPVERGRPLTDLGATALAAAVCLGAWWHWSPPLGLWPGAVLVGTASAARRPWLLVLGGFVLASALGVRSIDGLIPVAPAPYDGRVTLLADPQDTPFGVRVDVRVGHRRLELQASDGAAGSVGRALAGERLVVHGRLRPPPPDAPWLVPRHVVGRLTVDRAEPAGGGAAPWRAANRLRRMLARGAVIIREPSRSLYGGFVLGDDRGQPPGVVDDFRASGLTHLLVVSGSNVAYLLVVVSPVTRRLSLGGRWTVTIAVIGGFAVVTRFEPSVLRASAMAAIAVTATLMGRPTGSLRLLALAVAALVSVDPLIVRSVGFQLSVAASLGIALLGPPLTRGLSGPAWFREALGVTLAAQLGVAPVLVPRFGGMPVVAVAANVVAVPVAGLVTTWGLPAGVVAGVAGPGVGRWAHLPTRVLIGWVAGVARVAAGVPLGEIDGAGLVIVVLAVWAAVVLRRRRPGWRAARTIAVTVGVLGLLAPAVALRSPAPDAEVVPGARVVRSGGATVLVLAGRPSPASLLEALRRGGVRRLDVVASATDPAAATLAALRHRWPVGRVLVTSELAAAVAFRVGGVAVRATPGRPPVVEVVPDRAR